MWYKTGQTNRIQGERMFILVWVSLSIYPFQSVENFKFVFYNIINTILFLFVWGINLFVGYEVFWKFPKYLLRRKENDKQ